LDASVATKFEYIENRIFLVKALEVFKLQGPALTDKDRADKLEVEFERLWTGYLRSEGTAGAMPLAIKELKGGRRESEVDRVWALSCMPMGRIHHMRSSFYVTKRPLSLEADILPVVRLLRRLQPSVVSVAFDPEGTGPDTHYKVLKIVAEAVHVAIDSEAFSANVARDLVVWGYRNVWFTFTPSDATMLIPVSKSDLELMHQTFMKCFTTQKDASYPSALYDGPFSGWSRTLQENQCRDMQKLLGRDCNLLGDTDGGFIFIKAMSATQFLQEVERLKSQVGG